MINRLTVRVDAPRRRHRRPSTLRDLPRDLVCFSSRPRGLLTTGHAVGLLAGA